MKKQYVIIFIILFSRILFAGQKEESMENINSWQIFNDGRSEIRLLQVQGKTGQAMQLDYLLKGDSGWVAIDRQVSREIGKDTSLNFYLQAYAISTFEIKFIDHDGSVFGKKISLANQYAEWTPVRIFFNDLTYWWGGDNKFDRLKAISLAVSGYGEGKVCLDEIYLNEKFKKEKKTKIGTLIIDSKLYKKSTFNKEFFKNIKYPDSYKVSIDDEGWFVVNGERFFIKGMQLFEHHGEYRNRNGKRESVLVRLTPEQLDYELKMIRNAGFNAVASDFDAKFLEIARKNGLMVFQTASKLFFTDMTKVDKQKALQTTRETMAYCKQHDNILCYAIDNEPNIHPGIYQTGEDEIEQFHINLMKEVRKADKQAFSTCRSFPPAAFLDHSIYDCIAINIYPGVYFGSIITYDEYGEWFRQKYANKKPYFISEYGWGVPLNLEEFSERMIDILDDQIKMCAMGSFFFIWRAWIDEFDGQPNWYGFIPVSGSPYDYKNEPRQIYYDYQKYNEAIVVEPRKDTVYINKLPLKVYGTERTAAITVKYAGKTYNLNRQGKYWWQSEIMINPDSLQKASVIIDARNGNNELLVRKEINFYTGREKIYYRARIEDMKGDSSSIKAKVKVIDHHGNPVKDHPLRLSVNQSKKDLFGALPAYGKTDEKGIYYFIWQDIEPGYFTLMAAPFKTPEIPQVYADVVTVMIE